MSQSLEIFLLFYILHISNHQYKAGFHGPRSLSRLIISGIVDWVAYNRFAVAHFAEELQISTLLAQASTFGGQGISSSLSKTIMNLQLFGFLMPIAVAVTIAAYSVVSGLSGEN